MTIEAEKDTELWVIPAEVYQGMMEESAPVANYTNELMAARFSDVMWLIEQIMWKSLDKRVAAFLLEVSAIEGSRELKLTHEAIANHLGSHREVITGCCAIFRARGWSGCPGAGSRFWMKRSWTRCRNEVNRRKCGILHQVPFACFVNVIVIYP